MLSAQLAFSCDSCLYIAKCLGLLLGFNTRLLSPLQTGEPQPLGQGSSDAGVNSRAKTASIYLDILLTTKLKKKLTIYVFSLKMQKLRPSWIKYNTKNHILLAGIRARLVISRSGFRDWGKGSVGKMLALQV